MEKKSLISSLELAIYLKSQEHLKLPLKAPKAGFWNIYRKNSYFLSELDSNFFKKQLKTPVMFDSNYNQITTASDYYNKNMNCGSKNVGVLPSQSKIYYKFTNIYNCQSNCKIITCKIKPNYTR